MATTTHETGRIALGKIRVPENVRALDAEHVKALAGSIKLQGMLVPIVVRDDGENGFELVAGFHRIAAARSLGLTDVPAVVRDADTEDADRAVENITSCRRRHDAINADRVVMPMSELKCPTVRLWTRWRGRHKTPDRSRQSGCGRRSAEVGAAARLRKRARHRHPATRSRFVRCDRLGA